jgi:2-keto-4-pentenoate hydratase/2-oxohepta-3-ene-1,7-dioic acid hydratase in catechol pathway
MQCWDAQSSNFAFACGQTPSQVLAIGMNYASHAKEMNKPVPQRPIVFSKGSSLD